MIELRWKSGGFTLYSRAEQAVDRVQCELELWLRDEHGMAPQARETFCSDLTDAIQQMDTLGYRRGYTYGPVSFWTGR